VYRHRHGRGCEDAAPRLFTFHATAGEAGVARALEILRADIERTLKLPGCSSIAELDRSYVNVPRSWATS